MPYCTNCGTPEQENQRFCTVCGSPRVDAAQPLPPSATSIDVTGAQVLVGVAMEPVRQSRWSTGFRGLLALPLFFLALIAGVAALFVSIAAWLCALFTGRVPDGVQGFLTNTLRLNANVVAYGAFVIPRWPRVTWRPRDLDQVTLHVDHVRLRRWSVFFRVVLGYPAGLVSSLLAFGTYPVVVVMWLWGVVAGRQPRALHQTVALVLRYQIRFQAYMYLVSPTQPFVGLFGDGLTGTVRPGPNDARPSGTGDTVISTRPTRWSITRASRVAVVAILLLGAPVYLLSFDAERPWVSKIEAVVARVIVNQSYTSTVSAMRQFEATARGCAAPTYDGCAAGAATTALQQLSGTASLLKNNTLFPGNAVRDARHFERNFTMLDDELHAVQSSSSAGTQYDIIHGAIPKTYARFQHSYRLLKVDLNR